MEDSKKKRIDNFINRHKTEDNKLNAVNAIMELERRLVTAEDQLEEYRKVFIGMSEAFEEMNTRLDRVSPKKIILQNDLEYKETIGKIDLKIPH